METFEYLVVWIAGKYWIDSAGREGELEERRHSQDSALYRYDTGPLLNELGSQGWELAGVDTIMLYLKRRRE